VPCWNPPPLPWPSRGARGLHRAGDPPRPLPRPARPGRPADDRAAWQRPPQTRPAHARSGIADQQDEPARGQSLPQRGIHVPRHAGRDMLTSPIPAAVRRDCDRPLCQAASELGTRAGRALRARCCAQSAASRAPTRSKQRHLPDIDVDLPRPGQTRSSRLRPARAGPRSSRRPMACAGRARAGRGCGPAQRPRSGGVRRAWRRCGACASGRWSPIGTVRRRALAR
jgi:hypothetical protein